MAESNDATTVWKISKAAMEVKKIQYTKCVMDISIGQQVSRSQAVVGHHYHHALAC